MPILGVAKVGRGFACSAVFMSFIFVRFRPDIRMAVIFVYLASVVTEPLERYLVESGKCEKKIQLRFRFPKLIVSVSGTVR